MSKPLAQAKAPTVHLCHCGAWGSFGLGLPIQHPTVRWCADHKPADFYTRSK